MTQPLLGLEHVRAYRETGGEQGHDWMGTQCLLLTTTGRKSGEPRVSPLIYAPDGEDRWVVVASKGGAAENPGWYENLAADPEVTIQVRDRVVEARARTAEGQERERLWKRMLEEWPDYAAYQEKTDRQIPVVVIEPR